MCPTSPPSVLSGPIACGSAGIANVNAVVLGLVPRIRFG
jgi:hypothetical protein